MAQDNEHNPDPDENAARILASATTDESRPAELGAAWAEWSSHIQQVDERGMTLLKAAFEAGYEFAFNRSAANLGRKGGLKGGQARAEKLTAQRRSEIAKLAAASRWNKQDD